MAESNNNKTSDKLIPSRMLKKSLDIVLSILGMSMTNLIFEDMWRSGIVFGQTKAYSIDQINSYFEKRFGKHAAELLMSQLEKELQKRQ
jgi:hypothetical protein